MINLHPAVVRAPRMSRQVQIQGNTPFLVQVYSESSAYLRYVEHENRETDAADVPVSTFECRTTAGFRFKRLRTYSSSAGNFLALLLFVLLLSACSISYSIGKSSDTVSLMLDSVSGSSTSMFDSNELAILEESYQEEITAATSLFVANGSNREQFLTCIDVIARNHGIADWTRKRQSYLAMGRGLHLADIDEDDIAGLPFFNTLAGTAEYAVLLQGYHRS